MRTREIPQWAALVAIVSILLVVLMTPFAQTQFLRLVYNILLGSGPLAIGYVLWRGGGVKMVAGEEEAPHAQTA